MPNLVFSDIRRISAFWIVLMSGAFAFLREVWFAYQATQGRPVPPGQALATVGRLAIVAFIISVLVLVYEERAKAKSLLAENAELRGDLTSRLEDYRDELLAGSRSTASPHTRLTEAREQFKETVALAEAGDVRARAKLPIKADRLLAASRDYNASGTGYVVDDQLVTSSLERLGIGPKKA